MASASGANLVRYFFYKDCGIKAARKLELVKLAYQAATDQELAPKAILIRADIHDTTTANGFRQKDPKGWHGTFAFKNGDQVTTGTHIATHGYTTGREDFQLKEADHTPEKSDATKKRDKKPVWPAEKQLEEYTDSPIAYCYLVQPKK